MIVIGVGLVIPGIIPFFGRSKWFQKEESHKGTFFLEVFDKEHPSKPIVQLQKKFKLKTASH